MKNLNLLIIILLSLLLYQCDNIEMKNDVNPEFIVSEKAEKVNAENERAIEEAKQLKFNDSDFLQTKQPMSQDAIAPYDYRTGLIGDKMYNNVVFVNAIERARKHFSVENNQLILNLKKGAEINMAEDLFEYIVDLFADWSRLVKEGRFEIVKDDKGYYDIDFPNNG